MTQEPVEWVDLRAATVSGGDLVHTGAAGWTASGLSSKELTGGNAKLEITAADNTTGKMWGLSDRNPQADFESIRYAFYSAHNQWIYVYESGVLKGQFATYVAGDALSVEIESGAVKYKKNGTTFYTSSIAPTYPLFVDAAIYSGAVHSALITGAWITPPLVVTEPQPWQLFQRPGSTTGPIFVVGSVTDTHDVEARFANGPWTMIATGVSGAFAATLQDQPATAGTLEVRPVGGATVGVPHVAVGEMFAGAGQSNMVGQFTNPQIYTSSKQGTLGGNDYFWHQLTDPTDNPLRQADAVSIDGAYGSVWPLVMSQLADYLSVPVGFIPCGKNASGSAAWLPSTNHLDRTTLYGSCAYRIQQARGVRGVLWWQGETDAAINSTTAAYRTRLDQIGDGFHADAGVKILPAKFEHCIANSGIGDAAQANINAAIFAAWGNGNVLAGPDLSAIDADDSCHPTSDAKAAQIAALWTAAIKAAYGW